MVRQTNEEKVDLIFEPNKETGISEWKPIEYIIEDKHLSWSNNGNVRNGICFGVDKYNWGIERLNNKPLGKILKLRTSGFSKNRLDNKPVNKEIRVALLEKYKNCLHCGSHSNLVIDHKNDMYNDKRVLNEKTQTISDFQVLCNGCNKNLKGQANVKEKKRRENSFC